MGMKPFFKGQQYNRDYNRVDRGPSPGGGRQQHYQDKQPKQCYDDVMEAITKLKRMSELKPKDFTDLEGYAAKIAGSLDKESNSQLRKFFEPLVEIETMLRRGEKWEKLEGKLHMSIPMLAYAVGRKLVQKEFYTLMEACIKKIDIQEDSEEQKKESFKRFMEFLRAIVAYNKYFKG